MGATKNLVLGGSGTIGSSLCRFLQAKGEEVINLDLKNGFDLRTQPLDTFPDVDFVWFLAWEVGGSKYLSNPANQYHILNNNTLLCSRVFAYLQRTKIPFLFTSSQLAAPDTAYGITKLLGENYTETLGGINVRFWNVYGWEEPDEKSHVITDMVMQALVKKKIDLLTTGEEERQFIFIEDCVKNLYQIRNASPHKAVHLTNGKWMKILELAQVTANLLDATVVPGSATGYQNKIDADASYQDYAWDTSITDGIKNVADQAREYIKKRSDVVKFT